MPEGTDFYGVHQLSSFAFQLLVRFDQGEALTENVKKEKLESFSLPLAAFLPGLQLANFFLSKNHSIFNPGDFSFG